jgi:hypothetical protein
MLKRTNTERWGFAMTTLHLVCCCFEDFHRMDAARTDVVTDGRDATGEPRA